MNKPIFQPSLIKDTRGVALLEFGLALPVFLVLSLGGAELTNYVTVKMRMSQIALQVADNAARMGSGTATQAKQITETDINDVFNGAQLSSGKLDIETNGRIILSDLEQKNSGSTPYRIVWQRCYGKKTNYGSSYGNQNANVAGMGESGRQVTAQSSTPTMFVEVRYDYKPLISAPLIKSLGVIPVTAYKEIASMAVRDRRDVSGGDNGIYNTAGAPAAKC